MRRIVKKENLENKDFNTVLGDNSVKIQKSEPSVNSLGPMARSLARHLQKWYPHLMHKNLNITESQHASQV